VGAVTHPRHGGYPENRDQPYGTEYERAGEPAADTPVRSQEAGRPALPKAQSQGAEAVQAARRRSRQRAPKGEANGRYTHGLLTAEAIEERVAFLEAIGSSAK
jgi:hypothetical protein